MATPARGQVGAIHVWLEWLDAAAERECRSVLDADERARADRFRFERDRRRFVARRAFLRRTLAGYTGVTPASIRYQRPAGGKPRLLDPHGLAFSTSHADGLAIVAVASRGEVGVDIERVRPMPDALDIARRFFAEAELEHLHALPGAMVSGAFLRLWTRKEAYVKALGRGLSMPLDAFDALGPVVPPSIRLWPLDAPPGFVATVAATASVLAPVQPAPLSMAS